MDNGFWENQAATKKISMMTDSAKRQSVMVGEVEILMGAKASNSSSAHSATEIPARGKL